MPDPAPLTKPELAERCGVSIRAVEHWLKAGLPSRLEKRNGRDIRVFDLAAAEPWIAQHREGVEGEGRDVLKVALDEAELRKRIAQAGKLEIQLAIARGEVIPAEDVERGRLARIQAVTAALDAFPAQVAPVLESKSASEVQAILTDEVRRIRAEFAGGGV